MPWKLIKDHKYKKVPRASAVALIVLRINCSTLWHFNVVVCCRFFFILLQQYQFFNHHSCFLTCPTFSYGCSMCMVYIFVLSFGEWNHIANWLEIYWFRIITATGLKQQQQKISFNWNLIFWMRSEKKNKYNQTKWYFYRFGHMGK